MANESSGVETETSRSMTGIAPGLVGVYGRVRVEVAGKEVGTLIVEGIHVQLIPDTQGPADTTIVCASDEDFRSLLKGELNPFIASMRGWARLRGDRNLGTKVILGLRVGTPFVTSIYPPPPAKEG